MSVTDERLLVPVEIGTQHACVKIELFDGALNRAASGYGRLQADLPAGLYQLQFRAGPAVQQRLISVRPGEGYRETGVEVPFASPAPLTQTTTTREPHQGAVENAVRSATDGAPARFLVVLRNMLTRESPERFNGEPAIDPADGRWRLELVDAAGSVVSVLNDHLVLDADGTVATAVVPSQPGGHLLRVTRQEGESFDQALWVSKGWQTMIFIPHTPAGPAAELASVHGSALGAPWLFEQESEDISLAVEMALANLRQGRASLPEAGLVRLLSSKFGNPMLGLLGAHLLLLRPEVDWELFDVVLGNLESQLMGADQPDVQVLRGLGAQRSGGRITPPTTAVSWPPLLHQSFTSLLKLDAEGILRIESGSAAERVAPFIVEQGSWTSWRSEALGPAPTGAAPQVEAPAPTSFPVSGEPSGIKLNNVGLKLDTGGLDMVHGPLAGPYDGPGRGDMLEDMVTFGPPPQGKEKKKKDSPSPPKESWTTVLERMPVEGPAAERVRTYLLQVARNEEPKSAQDLFRAAEPKYVSLSTSLPLGTVTKAMSHLKKGLDL